MAKTYLSCKIDRKCFKTIHSMYDKAKYCVNCCNIRLFTSFTGVRQGEKLSPTVLFSIFLNGLQQFYRLVTTVIRLTILSLLHVRKDNFEIQ